MGSIDVRLTSIIFSDYPNLTLTTEDFTSEVANLSWNGDFVNRMEGLTGSILSSKLYVVASLSIKVSKESPRVLEFWKQAQNNCKLTGTATFSADIEGLETLMRKIDVSFEDIGADGNTPALGVVIRGDYLINKELVV